MKQLLLSNESELAESSDKVLILEGKVSGLNHDLMSVVREKEGLKKTADALKSTTEKARAAAGSQLEAKVAHQKSMAKIRIQEEES